MNTFRLLIFSCLCLVRATAAEVGVVAPDEAAIKGAIADKGKAARASWWGFDPADSTKSLQAAIDSGVGKLVVENMGAPWVTDRITLRSDQEIVFEKGVVVLAKRGAFQSATAALFTATLQKNITLTGQGATLRMWKQDYADPEKYKKAEWRNVLSLFSCANVRITGLTLADSGGDGIYLGVAKPGVPCSDVLIKNVTCVNNYRQGISVISARNLLIEDCVLKDTSGTAPESGIDFEPNKADEELSNCVMRNCVSENNRGRGYLFALGYMRDHSAPLSVRLENCRSLGNLRSLEFASSNQAGGAGVKGAVDFINCRFEGSQQSAILIRDKAVTGARLTFKKCEIAGPAAQVPDATPIQFSSSALGADTFGAIHFEQCHIDDPIERLPMSYKDYSGGVGLAEITGTIRVIKSAKQETSHELTQDLVSGWMPFRSFKQIGHFKLTDPKFEPATSSAEPGVSTSHAARQRGLSEWLLWAQAHDKVTFHVEIKAVGKGEPRAVAVSLVTPSGELVKLADSPGVGDSAYEFEATERGAYKIVCEARNWTATVNSSSQPVCLYSQNSLFHLLGTVGDFFFWRPPGGKEFAIKVSGGGGSERVKAALVDPRGKVVEEVDNISQAHQFIAPAADGQAAEIWSVRLARPSKGVMEDFNVQLQGVPPVLSPTRTDLLRPLPNAKTEEGL
jgi:hypothetical protein